MTTMAEPYFMENDDWYYLDPEEMMYQLTDEAPEEAVESYEAFYEILDNATKIEDEETL